MNRLFFIEPGEGEEQKEFQRVNDNYIYGYSTIYGALMATLRDIEIDLNNPMRFAVYFQHYGDKDVQPAYTFEDIDNWHFGKVDILKSITTMNKTFNCTVKFKGTVPNNQTFGIFTCISDDAVYDEPYVEDINVTSLVHGTARAFWFIRPI